MRRVLLQAMLVCLMALPLVLHAQSVRGVVTDGADRPLTGIVVLLVDSGSTAVARTLSNQRGEFRLTAPEAGEYRIRMLRIGFTPSGSGIMHLAAGQVVTRRIAFGGNAFTLDTVRVASRNTCRLVADSALSTFAVWEQVRTALSAAQVTADARIAATTLAFQRQLDPGTLRVLDQKLNVTTAFVNAPWLSEAADSLRAWGYVRLLPDLVTAYYAPGIDVLLSRSFTEDHCFHLVRTAERLGLAFEPAPHRKLAEIRGTLWLDRQSSRLRVMQFGYANVSKAQEERAGGEIEYEAMKDGSWAITRWSISMPVLQEAMTSRSSEGTSAARVVGASVRGVVVSGGELVLAQRGRDTLFSRETRALRGIVTDSTTGRPTQGAWIVLEGTLLQAVSDSEGHFHMNGVLPGIYTMHVSTPALDSLNAEHRTSVSFDGSATPIRVRVPGAQTVARALCGATPLPNPGIVLGSVSVRGDSAPPRDLRIQADWDVLEQATSVMRTRRLESKVDANGAFRFCGVPTNTAVVLRTVSDSGAGQADVNIPPETPLHRAELAFDWKVKAGAAFLGVVSDSLLRPIAGAQILLTPMRMLASGVAETTWGIAKAGVTNDSGAFHIPDLPLGSYHLTVKSIGFSVLEAQIDFTAKAEVRRRLQMTRATTLASVVTTERAIPESFDEHRRASLGSFVMRDELDAFLGRNLGSLLEQKRGLNIAHGQGNRAWAQARRSPQSFCRDADCVRREKKFYVPTKPEMSEGMKIACYMQVFLDRTLMNPGQPTEPFDLNTLVPEMLEGIEIYASEAETPSEYRGRGALCGAMVIWSRRNKSS